MSPHPFHGFAGVLVVVLGASACGDPPKPSESPDESTDEQAIFTDPDFESDAIGSVPGTPWQVTINSNRGITDTRPNPQTLESLNLKAAIASSATTTVVGGATETQTDPDLGTNGTFRFPKYGNRAARANYTDATLNGKKQSVNTLLQTVRVTAADVDPMDNQVHVRFTISPMLENPAHVYTKQPYYFVRVQNTTTTKTIYQDFNVAGQAGVPWKTFTDASGNAAEYIDWSLVDVSLNSGLVSVGDQIELLVVAAGCAQNGHWGRVYLDSFGENIPGLYTWSVAPQSASAGQTITYKISYRNGGTATTYGTKLDFVTPPSTTFASTSLGGACTGVAAGATGTESCTLGTLAPGNDGSFTVTVNVPTGTTTGTVITNGQYSIYATGVSPLIGSKISTTVTAAGAAYSDLKVTATDGKTQINWGDPTTYTITVTNAGPAAATAITVTDTMPDELTGVTWTCSTTGGGSCTASGTGNIAETTVALPSGAVATYVVQATVKAGSGTGTVKTTVTATPGSSTTDPDTSTNSAVDLTTIGAASLVSIVGGDGQSTTVLTAIAQPLVVKVTDAFGNPVSGITVTLHVPDATGPSAQLTDAILTSGADGTASTTATAGRHAGSYDITVTTSNSTTAFHLTSVAGAPAVVTAVAGGSPQSATVLTAFAAPLAVIVEDAFDNPCIGVSVAFTAPASGAGATVSAPTVATDVNGRAQATVVANATTGSYIATATVTGPDPAGFSLTNIAGQPAQISASGGDGQSAVADTDFTAALTVLLVDGDGNPVPNATVMFSAPNGGATAILSASSVATDATGHASVTIHAGTVAGGYTITATTAGAAAPVQFALTNAPDVAVALTVLPTSSPQTAQIGAAYPAALTAVVADQFGNGIAGASVAFTAPATGASGALSAPSATTDASGRATVTITANTTTGSFAVTAQTTGVAATAAFALQNLNGPAQLVSVRTGSHQRATVDTEFAASLVVRVQDAGGNPVFGAAVEFHVPASGATATPLMAIVMTNMAGDAALPVTAGTLAGDYEVTAQTDQGAAPIVFSLTNLPGAPVTATLAPGATPQTTRAGSAFAAPLTVTVVDAFDNPVGGATVAFTTPGSDPRALLSVSSDTTADDGTATTLAIAGNTVGTYQVVATVTGIATPLSFTLTNTVGPPSALVAVSGAGQHAMATTAFADRLVVRVIDALGNPVAGATVTLTTPTTGSSGTLADTTLVSDDDGVVSTTLTANTTPGSFAVFASITDGAAPIHLAATVDAVPTVTTITAPAEAPVDLAFTGTVTVTAAILVATGQVEVYDDTGVILGGGPLDATGNAQVSITVRTRGHHAVAARYRAQAQFAASNSATFDFNSTHDNGRLTGAGTDCNAGGGRGGLGFLVVLGALVIARSRRRRLAWLLAGLVPLLAPGRASAQEIGSRAIERLHPASAESEWFALDSVDFGGHRAVAVAVLGDFGYRPLVIYNANDSRRANIVRDQLVLHFAASLTLWERFRISAIAPLAPYQAGEAADYNGMSLVAPTYAFGDLTVAGDMRLVGLPGDLLRIAVGVRFSFPTGSRTNYMSDGILAGDAHALAAGTLGYLEYAADAQILLRQSTTLADEKFGSELQFSAAIGARLAGGKLVIGPEMFGALPLMSNSDIGHPIEVGGGLHYRFTDELGVGLGGTVGLVHAVGTPEERILLSLAWML